MALSSKATFRTISDLGNLSTRFALQLHAVGPVNRPPEEQEHDPVGTATVIAPHLAITCKHVITDYLQRYRVRLEEDADTHTNFALTAFMFMEDGRSAVAFGIQKMVLCEFTDVAILRLGDAPTPAPFDSWLLPRLDLFAPSVGSRIHAVGYHSATFNGRYGSEGTISITRDVAMSEGEVIEVHPRRRDARLNFPCFHTDARFDGGMSGGPVFNADGALCGIISSNLPPTTDDEAHVSYVATLAPIAAARIDFGRALDNRGHEFVLQLMLDGVIATRGHEFVAVSLESNGTTTLRMSTGGATWVSA